MHLVYSVLLARSMLRSVALECYIFKAHQLRYSERLIHKIVFRDCEKVGWKYEPGGLY